MIRTARAFAVVAVVVLLAASALPARASTTPPGYRERARSSLGSGVVHRVLERRGPEQVVHVASFGRGAPATVRPVLSNDAVGGMPALERTSAMCARARCIAAVNADFFTPAGTPLGALAFGDEPVRSPNAKHHQLSVTTTGAMTTGPMSWSAKLVTTDLRSVGIDGVNVARQPNRAVIYTPWFGPTTATNRWGVELVLDVPSGPIRINETSVVRLVRLVRGGGSPIPPHGAVVSAHGAAARALESLWADVAAGRASDEALLRVTSTPDVTDSVGGTPVLVRAGARWFADEPRAFVRSRHPRTMVGWTRSGETLLVVVDGRQPGYSRGMSLREAADLMIALGAVEAINLDGGGSSTFVVRGAVANRPSDVAVRRGGKRLVVSAARRGDTVLGRVERPVANALAIVATGPDEPPPPLPASVLRMPKPVETERGDAPDPASDPTAALPGLLAASPSDREDGTRALGLVFALGLVATSAASLWRVTARRRAA